MDLHIKKKYYVFFKKFFYIFLHIAKYLYICPIYAHKA